MRFNDERGFTLIELVAVVAMIAIMGAVLTKKIIDVDTAAKYQALNSGITELNSRENLTWVKEKLAKTDWQSDAILFAKISYSLGTSYSWTSAPTTTGGTLSFEHVELALDRAASTMDQPATWKMR